MANIQDVANLADVSPMTVSRVINGSGYVREATRERVVKAMQDLHYVPNRLARSLVIRKTQTVALILPDITNPFFTMIARSIEDSARSNGYQVILCNSDEDPEKEREYVQMCISMRVDGVILAPSGDHSKENLEMIQRYDICYVCVDREVPGIKSDLVCGDSVYGSYELTKHLIALGHKHIAIATNLDTSTGRYRLHGYQSALKDCGLTFDASLVAQCSYKNISQNHLVEGFLEASVRPTAVFATNNFVAMALYDALVERGLNVPEDLAMTCFDDVISFPDPFFTTAKQPTYEMGTIAMRILTEQLRGERLEPRQIVLTPEIAIRKSSGNHVSSSK